VAAKGTEPAGGSRHDLAWAAAGVIAVAAIGSGLSASTTTSGTPAATTTVQAATGIQAGAAPKKARPTTRLGDLTRFATIVTDVQGRVAKNDLAGGKTRVKDLEVAWDDAEAGLKPRDPAKWHQLDDQIDAVLTALRSGSPSQSDCASTLEALSTSLNKFDGV
jgi:hypothetical protein